MFLHDDESRDGTSSPACIYSGTNTIYFIFGIACLFPDFLFYVTSNSTPLKFRLEIYYMFRTFSTGISSKFPARFIALKKSTLRARVCVCMCVCVALYVMLFHDTAGPYHIYAHIYTHTHARTRALLHDCIPFSCRLTHCLFFRRENGSCLSHFKALRLVRTCRPVVYILKIITVNRQKFGTKRPGAIFSAFIP